MIFVCESTCDLYTGMADVELMKLAKDWCKKDDIPVGSALLLVGERFLDEPTEALARALSKTIKHLVGVS